MGDKDKQKHHDDVDVPLPEIAELEVLLQFHKILQDFNPKRFARRLRVAMTELEQVKENLTPAMRKEIDEHCTRVMDVVQKLKEMVTPKP